MATKRDAVPAAEHPLRVWILLPTDYGVFCWIFVFWPGPLIFLAGYTAMFLVNRSCCCSCWPSGGASWATWTRGAVMR